MTLDTVYLRSRLGRRILWLFVICALLPISVLALISLISVSGELQEQSLRGLNQASHDEGMIIFEKLLLLDTHLASLASDAKHEPRKGGATSGKPGGHFRGVTRVGSDGRVITLAGVSAPNVEFSERELLFLDSGKTLLAPRKCEGSQSCIYLARESKGPRPDRELVIAEVEPGYLWSAEDLPGSAALSIFDQDNQLLFDSRNGAITLPRLSGGRSSGELEWAESGQTHIGEYWKLPMKAKFFQDHWTVLASEEKQVALASLGSFRRSFPLVILLALWVVLLLSLILIRRTLVPLERLREGTGRVARGEFEARVAVESRDEFQDLATSFNFMAGRIETQVRSLKTLNEIDRAILSSWELDHIVRELVGRLPDLLSYEVVGITVVDSRERTRATTYMAGVRGEFQTSHGEISADELSALDGKTESFLLERGNLFPQYLLPLVARGMHHFLVVPVCIGGRLAAVLAFGRSGHETWDQEDRQQAQRVADQVAVALSNAGLVSELKEMRWGTMTAFARAIDAKSPWTAGHSERVTIMGIRIGQELGLPAREIDILHAGGLLHDIGKIGIPAALLDKPGALTEDERLQIQEHVLIGVRILKPIRSFAESLPVVQEHHERFDGTGYPYGLRGEAITLHGRIFAVADVHDALISERPYRAGVPLQRVMTMIREGAGTQFDPRVVEAFFRVLARQDVESIEPMQPLVEVGAAQ